MESSSNPDGSGAQQAQAIATIIRQIATDSAAGKKVDTFAIIAAHPELQPGLSREIEKLQRSQQTQAESGKNTTTFIPEELRAAAKPEIEIPGYSMISEIGRGGQAVVYLAIQISTGRKRAIKVLREGRLADSQATARFAREIATLASLQHPFIVPIIDTGETPDGHRYMVMDYISGKSLDEFIKSRSALDGEDPSRLLKMFVKICAAVNVAHRSGIIHRDLKPSNILVDDRGEPHILDFGLARTAMDRFMRADTGQVSVTGEFLGSLPWSSPEQAEGDPDRIDIRTDVYSLGVILYQILTGGHFPYAVVGNIRDVLDNILTAKPTPPTKVVAAARAHQTRVQKQADAPEPAMVNQAMEQIVLKALAKKAEARYQTAGELGRDINNYLHGLPTARATKPTITLLSNTWKYVAAIALVLGAGFAVLMLIFRHQPPPPPPVPVALASAPPAATQPAVVLASAPLGGTSPIAPVTSPATAPSFPSTSELTMFAGTARVDNGELALTPRAGTVQCGLSFGDLNWSSYDLTFKAIANCAEGYSVWVHSTAPGTFLGFSPIDVSLPDIFSRVGGQFERIRSRRGRTEPDRWHDIRVLVHGSDVHWFVDGEEWFDANDSRFTHGRVVLVARSGAVRFRDIRVTGADGTILYTGPTDSNQIPLSLRDTSASPMEPTLKRVDLLKLVDPVKNAKSGLWSMRMGVLSTGEGAASQIEFPYSPSDEYDYRVRIQRPSGRGQIAVICAGNGHEFSWVIGGPGDSTTGLAMVDGKNFDANATSLTRTRGFLVNNLPHLLVVSVRRDFIRCFFDDTQHCFLKTDYSNISTDPKLKPPGKNTLGLYIGGDAVNIDSADVLEIPSRAQAPQ